MGRETPLNAATIEAVKAVLSDWTLVKVELHGRLWSISGAYLGKPHSGCTRTEKGRSDPVELARYMDSAARAEAMPAEPEAKEETHVETLRATPDDHSSADPPAHPAPDPVEPKPVEAETPDPRDAQLAALAQQLEDMRAKLDAAKAPPAPSVEEITDAVSRIAADAKQPLEWMKDDYARLDGEDFPAFKNRITQLINVELAELRRRKDALAPNLPDPADEERAAELSRWMTELADLAT